jgi:hypothetical protein
MKAWHANVPGVPLHQLTLGGETVQVRFATSKARASPGLEEWQLDARMSNPAALPSSAAPGDTTTVTMDGTTYLLQLVGSVDTRIQAAVNATGEKIRFLALEWLDWTVTRTTQTGTDPDTGAPTTTTSEVTVGGHFAWLAGRDQVNYRADTAGILTTLPGQLKAGDRVEHATFGAFIVSEASPRAYRGLDQAEVRRAA